MPLTRYHQAKLFGRAHLSAAGNIIKCPWCIGNIDGGCAYFHTIGPVRHSTVIVPSAIIEYPSKKPLFGLVKYVQ